MQLFSKTHNMAAHHASHDKPYCCQSPDNLWRWHDRLHSVPQFNSHTFVMPLALFNVKQQTIWLCMWENALSLSFFPSNKPFIRVSQTGTSLLCPVNLNTKIQYYIPNGVITVIPWSICCFFIFSLNSHDDIKCTV